MTNRFLPPTKTPAVALFALTILSLAQTLHGQDASYYFRPVPEPKNFGTILFAFGPTKAAGELGKTLYRNGQSGFVEVGFSGSISYVSPQLAGFGLIARGIGVINPVDNGMLRVALEDQLLNGQSSVTSISNAEMGAWSHVGGLGGVNLSLPSDRLTIEIRALGGALSHSRPELSFDYTAVMDGVPDSGQFLLSGNRATAAALQLEGGFRYSFSTGAALGITAGYLTSRPDRTISTARGDEIRIAIADPIPVPTIDARRPSISMVYLNFGFGFNLGTK